MRQRTAALKSSTAVEAPANRPRPVRARASRPAIPSRRECLTLGDPTDCLLDAYDCVARRAYEHFLVHGPRPCGEVEDWLTAERELLLNFPVNVHESSDCVYALASVPGATAARLSVGIESRWLVILFRHAPPTGALRGPHPARMRHSQPPRMHDPQSARMHDPRAELHAGIALCPDVDRPAKSVCVIQLPADVDATSSIAVLGDGLLGIRMPKILSRL
jgi:HSP20 family molecular chaperone IbpA